MHCILRCSDFISLAAILWCLFYFRYIIIIISIQCVRYINSHRIKQTDIISTWNFQALSIFTFCWCCYCFVHLKTYSIVISFNIFECTSNGFGTIIWKLSLPFSTDFIFFSIRCCYGLHFVIRIELLAGLFCTRSMLQRGLFELKECKMQYKRVHLTPVRAQALIFYV